MAIKGVSVVRRNIKKRFKEIDEKQTHTAVFVLLSEIATDSAARTPIDTSNLVNSMYVPKVYQYQGKTLGYIGYTSEYAGWVHSAPGTLKGLPRQGPTTGGNYWDPNGEPRFLDKAAEYVEKNLAMKILNEVYRVR